MSHAYNHIVSGKLKQKMQKNLILLVVFLIFSNCQNQRKTSKHIVTTDVTNFWEAYDKIVSTQDSVLQYKYLDSLFFQKGTPGLKAIREVRDYTPQDYINAINNYPEFWTSVRENTLKANKFGSELENGIEKLRNIYPDLKPAKIYFTIGALRTNGVTLDSLVLIGSELAMSDKNTISSELPEAIRKNRRIFFDSNPIDDLVLLNVHEYVHTQQKQPLNNLLSFVIREGVAEFVSVIAMGVPSSTPAVEYGKQNYKVREKFEEEMFYMNNRNEWLWSDAPNDFGVRDLGYYIGYQMSENFYNLSENKEKAIKKLIELDFSNEAEIEEFVHSTGFLSKSLDELYQEFEKKRPTVIRINQFENNSNDVNPKIREITVEFSEPLNGYNTGVDFGELGVDAFPKNTLEGRTWAEDNKSWTIPVELEPNQHYQLLISSNFRTKDNIPLKPYLIEFKTRAGK